MAVEPSETDQSFPTSTLKTVASSWRPPVGDDRDPMPPGPATAFNALVGGCTSPFADDAPLPAAWHWFYFLSWPASSELGADGHPRTGLALPPLPHRRRMFLGGRIRVLVPLRIGLPAQRRSEVVGTEVKRGRSGEFLLVTVRSQFIQDGRVALTETQDLLYRSATEPQAAARETATTTPVGHNWTLDLVTDPVLLFRFSALTANAHRIHYDRTYARETEGYPDLVVHGPLQVLLMTELARRRAPRHRISELDFRLVRPLFVGEPTTVVGDGTEPCPSLAVLGPDGAPRAQATVRYEEVG